MCQLRAPNHTTNSHLLLEGRFLQWSNNTSACFYSLEREIKEGGGKIAGRQKFPHHFFSSWKLKYFQKTACEIPTLNATKINESCDAEIPGMPGKFQLDSSDGLLILETGKQSRLQRAIMMNGWETVNIIGKIQIQQLYFIRRQ